jgi:hypothetical protein
VITKAEADSVFHAEMAIEENNGNAYGGACSYGSATSSTADSLNYAFHAGTAASTKSGVPGHHVEEPSVGHNAYCSEEGPPMVGALYADVGNAEGSAYYLELAANSCAEAVTFAKEAFSRLA